MAKTVEPLNKGNRIGSQVRARRTEMGLSQTALAEETGVSVAEICRIELGERANPSMAIVINLGRAMKMGEKEFIKFIGYKE